MWAEARKHEKKLKGIMVDYRRRAERRREFYDKIRSDPAAFLQIHGNQMKVHIDANLSSAAESSLMPWMGDNSNLIDRFDVRAHLDRLDIENNTSNTGESLPNSTADEIIERQINYERYRNLVQNEFLGLNESKFLQQIWFEERFGVNHNQKDDIKSKQNQKKKLSEKKATISYNYENEDSTALTVQTKNDESSESEESSDEDYDFDTTVNIDHLDNESGHRINGIALKFGMKSDDFVKYLDEDKTEAEKIRVQKEIENEKSMFTGRKSRRERRALKEQRLMILRASNVEDSDKLIHKKIETEKQSQSSSESEVSVDENKIEFITSFGGSSEEDKPKESLEKKQKQVLEKRKQKIKSLNNFKIEAIPIVYGPTLPGEDMVPSLSSTSFHKSSHSKQRTYRFNDSIKRSRSRSRSRSADRYKYRRNERHFPRRSRSRSRELKRSLNRTPDRYRDRRRSRSRDRIRRRTRSRSRDRRRSRSRDTNRRKRSRTPPRRRSRSSSRTRRTLRRSTKSRDRKDRSRSRRRSRSRKRSRTRDNDRERDNSKRLKPSPSPKSHNKIVVQKDTLVSEETSVPIIETNDEIVENITKPIISEQKVTQIETTVSSDFDLNIELPPIKAEPIEEEKPVKVPSPPVKSYYRHDLCESGESDEELPQKDNNKTEKDEGYVY